MEAQNGSNWARKITMFVRIALGITFIYSSLGKIADPSKFAELITNYQLLPPALVGITAVCLPWLEAVCGLALVIGRLDKGAALLISLMMLVFTGVTLYNGYRGVDVACGCFSLSAKEPSNIALNTLRNSMLLIAGTWVMFRTEHKQTAQALQTRDRTGG